FRKLVNKHYSKRKKIIDSSSVLPIYKSHFRIPPINLEGSKDESQSEILSRLADPHFTPSSKWNIDLPVKFTIYSILMYSIVEILPVGLVFIPKHLLQ
ncbi:unnamed protein product, partial [Oikopleura dioica]